MKDAIRSFIAIEFPKDIKTSLSQTQAKLKQTEADVRWVNVENIHLTLKFLKEVDAAKIQETIGALEKVAKDAQAFHVSLSGVGVFPDIKRPRILWAGLKKPEQIQSLAAGIETSLRALGFPKDDRDFTAHITLGRIRSQQNLKALITEIEHNSSTVKSPEFPVDAITFFQSTLTPQGPIYKVLKKFPLIGSK